MEFEEFRKLVIKFVKEIPYDYEGDNFNYNETTIIQRHKTCGAEGGNCWGDDARYFSNHKSASEFLPLDSILSAVAPEIPYLKYRQITNIITEDHETDHEYYGNYTDYEIYKLDIRQLYDSIFA